MQQALQLRQTLQNISTYAMAATVAISGLGTSIEKFNDGDTLSGISNLATTLGSSLMILGSINPYFAAFGAAVTAAGTVVSVVNSIIEKNTEKLRESRDEAIKASENYKENEKSLNDLQSTYDSLISKQKLTEEEQSELNNTISSFQDILGEDNKFVAYYDESGQAVYKTKEQVQELIDKWKEEQKQAQISAKEDAKRLAKDDKEDYKSNQEDLQETSKNIQEYQKGLQFLQNIKEQYKDSTDYIGMQTMLDTYFTGAGEYSNLGINVSAGIDNAISNAENKIKKFEKDSEEIKKSFSTNFEDLGAVIDTSFAAGLSNIDDQNLILV
jgi:DNA repair exonuclease SbcCD ATPase subunit